MPTTTYTPAQDAALAERLGACADNHFALAKLARTRGGLLFHIIRGLRLTELAIEARIRATAVSEA